MSLTNYVEAYSARIVAMYVASLLVIPMTVAQETKEKVIGVDLDRNFMVRLPKDYDSQRHYPVVILLHGMNQDADDMERLTRFDELADKDSFIALYPITLHGRWNAGVPGEIPGPAGSSTRWKSRSGKPARI